MFDLVSTREGIDNQTAACARLIAGIISQAIQDASQPPTHEENKRQQNINIEAREAIYFIFGDRPAFGIYCSMIGVSAADLRKALLEGKRADFANEEARFPDRDRRIIKVRTKWFYDRKKVMEGHVAAATVKSLEA